MAKIQYLQGTHDARAGDIRDVAQPCAEVLVRLGKAEYITARRPSMANVEPFAATPKKPEIRT